MDALPETWEAIGGVPSFPSPHSSRRREAASGTENSLALPPSRPQGWPPATSLAAELKRKPVASLKSAACVDASKLVSQPTLPATYSAGSWRAAQPTGWPNGSQELANSLATLSASHLSSWKPSLPAQVTNEFVNWPFVWSTGICQFAI